MGFVSWGISYHWDPARLSFHVADKEEMAADKKKKKLSSSWMLPICKFKTSQESQGNKPNTNIIMTCSSKRIDPNRHGSNGGTQRMTCFVQLTVTT